MPDTIAMPDYAITGFPQSEVDSKFYDKYIEVKSHEDLEVMREISILCKQKILKNMKTKLILKYS